MSLYLYLYYNLRKNYKNIVRLIVEVVSGYVKVYNYLVMIVLLK